MQAAAILAFDKFRLGLAWAANGLLSVLAKFAPNFIAVFANRSRAARTSIFLALGTRALYSAGWTAVFAVAAYQL